MVGFNGVCPKCGARYVGWALKDAAQRICDVCQTRLDVFRDGVPFDTGPQNAGSAKGDACREDSPGSDPAN